jgi:hypothetical protein
MTEAFDETNHYKLVNRLLKHQSCITIRRDSWERSEKETEYAEKTRKPVDKFELAIGKRLEEIEWEVRNAVQILLSKGYTTYGSGYEGNDGLHYIHFLLPGPLKPDIVEKIEKQLDDKYKYTGIYSWWEGQSEDRLGFTEYNSGKPVYISGISFIDTRGDPKLIQNHWNNITETIPDSGYQLLINNAEFAEEFRRTH